MNRTYLYYILTLLCCLIETYTFDASVLTEDMSLNNLCPYTDYCTSNATKRLLDTTKTPCCGYCSCADDCWKRGNCCGDKQTITAKPPIESYATVLVNRNLNDDNGNDLPRYHVTKSCPTEDNPLEEKCSGILQSSIEELIWVTDSHTHIIYNNKHCARCHGVTAYTPWLMSTDCMEALNGRNSPIDATNHMISNCCLSVAPPLGMEAHTGRCFVPEITRCNMTGDVETYDKALESACNSLSQTYLDESKMPLLFYKNIYCFICNTQEDRIVQDVCVPYDVSLIRTDDLSFTGILDFTSMETVKEVASDARRPGPDCAIDEIRDHYQVLNISTQFEPCCEKTCLRGFRPRPTHTRLYSHNRYRET